MNPDILTIVQKWNKVIFYLLQAKRNWESLRKLVLENPRVALDEAPLVVQKGIAKFGKAEFYKVMPDFIGHGRALGGLEVMRAETREAEAIKQAHEDVTAKPKVKEEENE